MHNGSISSKKYINGTELYKFVNIAVISTHNVALVRDESAEQGTQQAADL